MVIPTIPPIPPLSVLFGVNLMFIDFQCNNHRIYVTFISKIDKFLFTSYNLFYLPNILTIIFSIIIINIDSKNELVQIMRTLIKSLMLRLWLTTSVLLLGSCGVICSFQYSYNPSSTNLVALE